MEFAPWLARWSVSDPNAKALEDFALANPAKWPIGSDKFSDFYDAITTTAPAGASRDELLVALGKYFERWSREGRRGFWGGLGQAVTQHFGIVALFLSGLIMMAILIYGIFVNAAFFDSIGQIEHARGLITFLFSFATIGIIVMVAIALFWMEKEEIEARFSKAKDLLAILVGILGTVMGFYFGNAATSGGAAPTMSLSAVTVQPATAASGGKVTLKTKVARGVSPYRYDVASTEVPGIDAHGTSSTDDIEIQVTIPDMTKVSSPPGDPIVVHVKVTVTDAKQAKAESTAELKISRNPAGVPAKP